MAKCTCYSDDSEVSLLNYFLNISFLRVGWMLVLWALVQLKVRSLALKQQQQQLICIISVSVTNWFWILWLDIPTSPPLTVITWHVHLFAKNRSSERSKSFASSADSFHCPMSLGGERFFCFKIKGCYLNAQLFQLGYNLAFFGVEGSEMEKTFRNSEINASLCDDWLAKGT